MSNSSAEEFAQMMQGSYGFDNEQAGLIGKAYDCFKNNIKNENMSKKEEIHTFFSNLAGLCINYSGNATRWRLTCGTPPTLSAMKYFQELGMSDKEVFDLLGAINFQHSEGKLLSNPKDYQDQGFCSNGNCDKKCAFKYHITDSKYLNFNYQKPQKDFAHELIQYAAFSNDGTFFRKSADFLDDMVGNLNYLSSFKGDIYSGRIGDEDIKSDIDAMNIYKLLIKSENEDFFDIMKTYNNGVNSNDVNRSKDFLYNLGNGDVEAGYEILKKEVDDVDWGSQYIASGAKSIIRDALFTNSIVSNTPLMDEETRNNLFDMREQNKVEEDEEINEQKKKFLDFVYNGWKNEND